MIVSIPTSALQVGELCHLGFYMIDIRHMIYIILYKSKTNQLQAL